MVFRPQAHTVNFLKTLILKIVKNGAKKILANLKKIYQNRSKHNELNGGINCNLNVCLGGCTITSKAKINVFCNFFSLRCAGLFEAALYSKKFQKTMILDCEANSALSCQVGLFFAF